MQSKAEFAVYFDIFEFLKNQEFIINLWSTTQKIKFFWEQNLTNILPSFLFICFYKICN